MDPIKRASRRPYYPHRTELDGLLERWRGSQGYRGLSARTIEERITAVTKYAEASGEPPLEFTRHGMEAWIGRPGLQQSSKWTYSQHLRAWHAWLMKEELRLDDPMVKMDRPRKPASTPRPVENYQLEELVSRVQGEARMMILLAAYAGLRVHEIAKVEGRDFDRTTGTLLVAGKGDKEALLDLHPDVIEEAVKYPRSGWWFPSPRGDGPVERHYVSDTIRKAMQAAGITATAHQLRHWTATALVEEGVDLRTVQEMMRHSSLTSTQIYTRVSRVRRSEAVRKLPSFVKRDEPPSSGV